MDTISFLQERWNRQYLKLLLAAGGVLICLSVFFGYLELRQLQEMMLLQEGMMASALLEAGISPELLADACVKEEITEQGTAFMVQIGHHMDTSFWLFPKVRSYIVRALVPETGCILLFCLFLFFAALYQMVKREALYQQAAELVEHFIEGDFSGHLPWEQTGTLYRLFSSIDQLAKALQTRCETEHEAKEFLKDMLSDISHQLKTPLSALQMYTEIMLKEPDHPETVQMFAKRSMQSLTRMEELILALLKIMRLDTNSIQFEQKFCPVLWIVEHAAEPLYLRAKQEGKQIMIEGSEKEHMFCDPVWTCEAISNLIKNALDHTSTGGHVKVSWELSPTMLRIFVKDDGCGIAPEDFYHIFKRFYRSSRSEDRKGVGLGLPLAKAIIEGQGGTLFAESVQGEGALFYIHLPHGNLTKT